MKNRRLDRVTMDEAAGVLYDCLEFDDTAAEPAQEAVTDRFG
jgi:hypothetical protein